MRKAISIHLIQNEDGKNSDCGWIVPQLFLPKTSNEPKFDYTVTEQIKGGEILAAHGQVLRSMEKIIGDEVARILCQLCPCDGIYQVEQELSGNEIDENAGGDFRQGKRAFERKADLEGNVHVLFIKHFLYVSRFQQRRISNDNF